MGSSTYQANSSTSNVTQTDDFNVGFDNIDGGTAIGGLRVGGDVGISITTTDQGAIDAAAVISRDAFNFASDANADAFGFASDVNADAITSRRDTFDFADRITKGTFGLAGDAFDFATKITKDATNAITGAGADALKFAGASAARESAAYGAGLDAVTREARDSRAGLINVFDTSFSMFGKTVDRAFDSTERRTGQAIDSLTGIVKDITSATVDTIAATSNATRSETSQGFETLIKYGTYAVVAIVGVMLFRK